jgi:serine/threonine protein kinase
VEAQSFVGRMLQVGPRDRSSVRQLLGHDFLAMFDIPAIIPLSCLVCEPTIGFTGKYIAKRAQKLPEETQEELKFQFLLESKESP